jgi:hypothetical protein
MARLSGDGRVTTIQYSQFTVFTFLLDRRSDGGRITIKKALANSHRITYYTNGSGQPSKCGRGRPPLSDAQKVENQQLGDLMKARVLVAAVEAQGNGQ